MSVSIEKKYKRGNLAKVNTPVKFSNSTKIKNLSGQRFGKLVAISYIGTNSNRNSIWECQCDCGEKTNAASIILMSKLKFSCGCITNERIAEIDRTKPVNVIGPKKIYKSYKKSAKTRKFEFKLTLEELTSLILENCYYCGSSFKNAQALTCGRIFRYNGIDRIDNTKGYLPDNVLTCCHNCNTMKNDMTIEDFTIYVYNLIKHSKNWLKP